MGVIDEFDNSHTVNEVARRLRVHSATIWRWILNGDRGRRLRSVHLGGRRVILARDLDAFLRPRDGGPGDDGRDQSRRADAAGAALDALGVNSHPARGRGPASGRETVQGRP